MSDRHHLTHVCLLVVVLATGASTAHRGQGPLRVVPFPPVDEAVRDPDLMAVRAAILRASVARDVNALESLRAPFSGRPGRPEGWLTTSARGRDLIVALGELLATGGAFVRPDLFCAPYWHATRIDVTKLPDHLVFEGLPWVVLLPQTPVFEKPDHESKTIGRLDLQLIEATFPPVGNFNRVRFNGQHGYVDSAALADPNEDRRACLGRRDGEWRLVRFEP
jgi:hypothetical protein